MGWQVITNYLPYLSQKFREVDSLLKGKLNGNVEETWRFCVDETNDAMSLAVASIYVRHEFDDESKSLATSMIETIKNTFESNFDRLGWMDFETRQAAREKAELMTHEIGIICFCCQHSNRFQFH